MANNPSVFKLIEIASWTEATKVSLPSVQRGFVWKPSQIEDLWDSLLRGYPIGAFVLTPKKEDPYKFEMLDGQQRATAISLGFGKSTFRKETQDNYKLFIDLEKPREGDNRKYIFRVISKSHPWGYQKVDNSKPLSIDDKRNSMKVYGVDDILEEELDKFFPYMASIPVPFHFFTNAAHGNLTIEGLFDKIKGWDLWEKVNNKWNDSIKKIKKNISEDSEIKNRHKESLELSTPKKIEKRIVEIYEVVKSMLSNDYGIPVLYLDLEKLKKQELSSSENKIESFQDFDTIETNKDETDAIENLFVRLNSKGTPLSGEELNYSILKSHLKNTRLIQEIENACKDFIKPSRFITIAYRLYQKELKQNSRESLSMRIKPKQFQKTISESNTQKSFEDFLTSVLQMKTYRNKSKTLIEYTSYLLEYDEHYNTYGLPHLITCKIADVAPEIMFLLLFRLKNKEDEFDDVNNAHRKMLGLITILMWLGKGEKQRDHSRVLSNIWPAAEKLGKNSFWSSSTIQRALLDEILTPLPSFKKVNEGKRLIKQTKDVNSKTNVWNRFAKSSDYYYYFIYKMFFERDLIIYAQREFLAKVFKKQEYHQDDTNMPFDWDHISPNKFIDKKKWVPKIVTDWYPSNGNLRAWPYSLNRTDQAVVPAQKLDPLNPEKYENEEKNLELAKDEWQKYINKNRALKIDRPDQLKDLLLLWSFCKNEKWAECDSNDMKRDGKPIYELIMERNFDLCEEWYRELCIEDLLNFKIESLTTILNKSKWKSLKHRAYRNFKKDVFGDDYHAWFHKVSSNDFENTFLFFQHSKNSENILEENNIFFGIFENSSEELMQSFRIKDKVKNDYDTDKKNYIQGSFTLISYEEDSYLELAKNFYRWLQRFPDKKIRSELPDIFRDSLATKYKARVDKEK